MIDTRFCFLNEIKDNMLMCCSDEHDSSDLINRAQIIIEKNIKTVSVPMESIGHIWAWLENKNIDIYARFKIEDDIYKLSENIKYAFKKGANGVQLFLNYECFDKFISDIYCISGDLFFKKDIFIGMDLSSIDNFDNVFSNLSKIDAKGLILSFDENSKKDFVGTIYGFLNSLSDNFDFDLHFMLGNDWQRIEQVWRLAEKIRPEIMKKIKFFVNS